MGENLGQHFLTDQTVISDIITASQLGADDTVLEIGPGKGVLTEALLQSAGKVVAVEKDPGLAEHIKERFSKAVNDGLLRVSTGDIRDHKLRELMKGAYKVVANIPYYLTSDILTRLLAANQQPARIVLLVQKEVAERIVAADGKNSRLSLFVAAYGQPEIVRSVPTTAFDPAPKVDSAVLQITDINQNFFANTSINADSFFRFIRTGFQHKRKKLVNNLGTVIEKEQVSKAVTGCELTKTVRPERLSLTDWKCLYKELNWVQQA